MDIVTNLDRINKEDAFSLAIALLYTLKGIPQYSILSELPYILDQENFIKLIKYYGGMTIRIPTIDEVSDLMRILLLYQYREVEELPWKEALIKAGFKEEDSNSARMRLLTFKNLVKSQEIGGREYE